MYSPDAAQRRGDDRADRSNRENKRVRADVCPSAAHRRAAGYMASATATTSSGPSLYERRSSSDVVRSADYNEDNDATDATVKKRERQGARGGRVGRGFDGSIVRFSCCCCCCRDNLIASFGLFYSDHQFFTQSTTLCRSASAAAAAAVGTGLRPSAINRTTGGLALPTDRLKAAASPADLYGTTSNQPPCSRPISILPHRTFDLQQ